MGHELIDVSRTYTLVQHMLCILTLCHICHELICVPNMEVCDISLWVRGTSLSYVRCVTNSFAWDELQRGGSWHVYEFVTHICHKCHELIYMPKPRVAAFRCVLHCVVVCCSVCIALQHTPECSVMQCVLQCVIVCCGVLQRVAACCSVLQRVAACCSVLQRFAAFCSVLPCVTACCSVLQHVAAEHKVPDLDSRVAACCSVLQMIVE